MKIMIAILVVAGLLAGCSEPVYETMGKVEHVANMGATPGKIILALPEDAAILTAADGDFLYTCNGYSIALQTFPAVNLDETVRSLCGYSQEELTVLQSRCGDHNRYDWVWVAAGEGGDVLCRASVLDDGDYHYSLCVFTEAGQVLDMKDAWNDLFSSFCLESEELV